MEEKTKERLTFFEKWFKIILWVVGIIVVLGLIFLFFASSSVVVSPQ